jgi:putative CocE/NonD family hydrolase
VPVVLEALPYRKDDATASDRPEYERLCGEYGYAVARVDLRGTGSSEGVAVDEYPASEQADLCWVIGWLASQPWSTGAVGMYGTSYSGFNSLQVAAERPPALKAVIAIYASDDRYTDDVHYTGGAVKLLDLVDYRCTWWP